MVKAEKLLILNLSTTSGRLSPLQIISKTGIRPPSFGLVEMEPLGSIGELRFQENLPHGLLLEDIPLSGCRKVALRLEDGSISHAARGGQPLLEPHSVRGGSSQVQSSLLSLSRSQCFSFNFSPLQERSWFLYPTSVFWTTTEHEKILSERFLIEEGLGRIYIFYSRCILFGKAF